jgi:hypothetical protein
VCKQPEKTPADLLTEVGQALYEFPEFEDPLKSAWQARLSAALAVTRETLRSWRRGHDNRFGPDHNAFDRLLALAEGRAEKVVRARDELREWLARNRGAN